MHNPGFPSSRLLQSIALAALIPACCAGLPLLAQAPATPATTPASSTNDPTRPEIQPSLSVDRDPIPSPDPDEITTTTATPGSNRAGEQAGEIRKRQDGVYTLHEDVDEVLLSCA